MRVIIAPLLLLVAQAWAQPSFLVTHTLPPGTIIRSSDLANDGGVVLGGGVDDDLNFVCRLDPAGNILWSSSMDIGWEYFGDPTIYHQPAFVRGLACLPNGNIMLVGQAGSAAPGGCTICATRHFMILDGDGEVLNDQLEYQPMRSQAWQGVLPLENGTVLLYGTHRSLSYDPGYICMYDPSSDQLSDGHLSSRQFNDFYPPDGILGMAALADGSYAAFGTDHIARLTSDLGSIWHLYFDANGLLDIQETSDGSLVLAWPDKLMRMTSTGELIWTKMIPGELGFVSGLESSTNGSVTVAGTTAEGAIWWGQVDLLGNIPWLEQWNETGSYFSLKGIHRHADERLSIVAQTLDVQPRVAVITTDMDGRLDACSVSGSTYELATSSIDTLLLTYNIGPVSVMGSGENSVVVLIPNYPLSTEQCESGFGRMSGTVYHDMNANGSQDPEDSAVAWQPVLVTPDQSYAYSTIQGYEADLLTPGTRTISLVHDEAIWGLSAGAGGHVVEITDVDTTITGIDFGLFALLDTAIVQCALTSAPTRCSMTIPQTINVLNQGTTTPDVLVALTMDPLITFVSSVPAPDSIAGDTIYWHIDDLPLFEQASITLQMLMPDFNAIGAELQATVRCYEVLDGGGLTELTESIWSSTLICSYDPNDKLVEPSGMGPVGAIPPETEWLTYTVRFQNTGNDTAFAVVIRDQLSIRLDRSSLEVLATSHELTGMTLTSGGLAAFEFDNILLPDSGTNELASHGFVSFRIRLQENLPHGTEIRNDAGIYFDLNPPVITNTVLNTIQICELDTFQLELRYENGELLVWSPTGIFLWDYFNMEWYLNGEPVEMNQNGNCTPELPGFYTVVLSTYYTGCVLELGPYQVISTAVRDIEMPLLRVLPNPFTDQLLVQCGRPHDHIELIDVNGHVVLSRSTGNTTSVYVDRDDLASGIYLLRMMQGTTVVATARVVAQ
jgi:hypothetical protein